MAEEELPQYDERVDVWSLGVIVFEALTGLQPFMADNAQVRSAVAAVGWGMCGWWFGRLGGLAVWGCSRAG